MFGFFLKGFAQNTWHSFFTIKQLLPLSLPALDVGVQKHEHDFGDYTSLQC